MTIRYILAVAFALSAFPAFAISITNLDKVPHTVTITDMGNEQTVKLEPNENFRCCFSPSVQVELENGQSQDGEGEYEYKIWPGGQLSLEDRRTQSRGRRGL